MSVPTKTKYSPDKIQKYIVATRLEGMTKASAFKEFVNDELSDNSIGEAVSSLEKTDRFLAILDVVEGSAMSKAKQAMDKSLEKYYERYGDLLDEGHEAIKAADSIEDKQAAMKEQRANLAMPVILNAQKANQEVKGIDTSGIIL